MGLIKMETVLMARGEKMNSLLVKQKDLKEQAALIAKIWAEKWISKKTDDQQIWSNFLDEVKDDVIEQTITIMKEKGASQKALNLAQLNYDNHLPPFIINLPLSFYRLSNWNLPLAGVLGMFLGVLSLGSIFRLMGMGGLETQFLSAAVGSFLVVAGVNYLTANPKARKILLALSVGGTVFEAVKKAFMMLTKIGGFWSRFSKQKSRHKILIYPLLFLIVILSRPQKVLPSQEQIAKTLEMIIYPYLQWLFASDLALYSVSQLENSTKNVLPPKVIAAIYQLGKADDKELQTAVRELIQQIKVLGFEGIDQQLAAASTQRSDGREVLIWSGELSEKFNVFGEAHQGEEVLIEDYPVMIKGQVQKKGTVRRFKSNS